MSAARSSRLVSRRRRHDDGEEESSLAGDGDQGSVSEGSVIPSGDEDADGDASDISGDEETTKVITESKKDTSPKPPISPAKAFPTTADDAGSGLPRRAPIRAMIHRSAAR